MEDTIKIEQKLYELLRPRFINSCSEEINAQIMTGRFSLSVSEEAACHLFDRIRIFYKIYETNDITKTHFVVSALFESPQFPKLMSCFSNAGEAKALFDSLKKEYCETK